MLRPLTQHDWPALHKLMLARQFPHVPKTYAEAVPHFRQASAFALPGTAIEAAFIFGPPEDGIAFFDAVCSAPHEGRWATPATLRALFAHAFAPPPIGLGLRAVWVQSHGAKALKAALKAGFVPVTPLGEGAPILVITPALVPPSLQKSRKE